MCTEYYRPLLFTGLPHFVTVHFLPAANPAYALQLAKSVFVASEQARAAMIQTVTARRVNSWSPEVGQLVHIAVPKGEGRSTALVRKYQRDSSVVLAAGTISALDVRGGHAQVVYTTRGLLGESVGDRVNLPLQLLVGPATVLSGWLPDSPDTVPADAESAPEQGEQNLMDHTVCLMLNQ